jgi:pilus assembly protein Flp/PilA
MFSASCDLVAPGETSCAVGANKMTDFLEFLHDESGATAIEYGLIAAGISVAIIAAVNALGTQLNTTFSYVSSQLATSGK